MTVGCEGGSFNMAARQNVLDALYELVHTGTIGNGVIDEISPRLLPESYPDIANHPHFTLGLDNTVREEFEDALRYLTSQDRLTHEQTSQTRAYLGFLGLQSRNVA